MTNNFERIKEIMEFRSDDDFYYLQILQRKKENELLTSNSRVIKNYYIKSIEYLENRKQEIIDLCNQFNARASIRLNRRSFEKVGFKAMELTCNTLSNRTYSFVNKCYDRACGQSSAETKDKKWIIDIDSPSIEQSIINKIIELEGDIIKVLPSKSGWHIITNPFRLDLFKKEFPEIEIHKDNPTNLYIP